MSYGLLTPWGKGTWGLGDTPSSSTTSTKQALVTRPFQRKGGRFTSEPGLDVRAVTTTTNVSLSSNHGIVRRTRKGIPASIKG